MALHNYLALRQRMSSVYMVAIIFAIDNEIDCGWEDGNTKWIEMGISRCQRKAANPSIKRAEAAAVQKGRKERPYRPRLLARLPSTSQVRSYVKSDFSYGCLNLHLRLPPTSGQHLR